MKKFETALINLGRAAAECVAAINKMFDDICKKLSFGIDIYFAPKSKVKHLALHAKKARARKKNIKRLLKERNGGNARNIVPRKERLSI